VTMIALCASAMHRWALSFPERLALLTAKRNSGVGMNFTTWPLFDRCLMPIWVPAAFECGLERGSSLTPMLSP